MVVIEYIYCEQWEVQDGPQGMKISIFNFFLLQITEYEQNLVEISEAIYSI